MFDFKINSRKDGRKSLVLYIRIKNIINNSLQISDSRSFILEIIQINNFRFS